MYFDHAQPVWLEGYADEMNITGGFRTRFSCREGDAVEMHLASSTFCHWFVDGKPCGFGPTRCAHGYFRVDEIPLTVPAGEHWLAVEVVGYHLNGFDTLDQPTFLQMELWVDGRAVAWTAADGGNMESFLLHDRLQKVQRYDFQRSFAECYRLRPTYGQWRVGGDAEQAIAVEKAKSGVLMPRDLPLYPFPRVAPAETVMSGTVTMAEEPWEYTMDRSVTMVGAGLKGFPAEEMELFASRELEGMRCVTVDRTVAPFDADGEIILQKDTWQTVRFEHIYSGFAELEITCDEPVVAYVLYDELLVDGDIRPYRQFAVNSIRYELEPGHYCLRTSDPICGQYVKVMSRGGACRVKNLRICRLENPIPLTCGYKGTDPELKRIFNAAIQSFVQNSADVFTDCPARERGGWLCDSYFTAKTEFLLTGANRMERLFIENYLLPESFPDVPEGMIPMCYPADHYDHAFIPNWAMWFILELRNYFVRTGDGELVARARERVYGILGYFDAFRNEYGLLEKLDGWIFVEWSDASKYLQDVNYPTNMLYVATLEAVAALYGDRAVKAQADQLRRVIVEQSYDGTFFRDHAVRCDGVLKVQPERTEVCQYYAYFFRTVTPDTHPELWQMMKTVFTPGRDLNAVYPDVAPMNVLPGYSMRFTLLDRFGDSEQLLQELKDRLTGMVEITGTLWENELPSASCIHGFISFVTTLIARNDSTWEKTR